MTLVLLIFPGSSLTTYNLKQLAQMGFFQLLECTTVSLDSLSLHIFFYLPRQLSHFSCDYLLFVFKDLSSYTCLCKALLAPGLQVHITSLLPHHVTYHMALPLPLYLVACISLQCYFFSNFLILFSHFFLSCIFLRQISLCSLSSNNLAVIYLIFTL